MSDPRTDPARALPSRTGAHRPRRGAWRDLVPTVAVLLAVVLIGLGAWALTRSTASTITPSGSDDGGSAPQATVPTAPTTPAKGGSPSPTSSRGPSSPASPSSSPASTVDHSIRVTVLNATRTSGLAASVAATLRSAGWTVPTTDNYRKSQPPTTVFYARADQDATARAVADDIGGDPKVQQSSEFGSDRITVVIGSDYSG